MPVYKAFVKHNRTVVGFLVAVTQFGNLLDRLLPEGKDGIVAVLTDTCNNTMTYELNGAKAIFLGHEDLHESKFEEYAWHEPNIEMYEETVEGMCIHDLYIYPTSKFRKEYNTKKPIIYSGVVLLAFFITAMLLVLYDTMVNR